MVESDSITPRQARVIASLLAGRTVARAAEDAGVSESTAYRYLRDEAVKAALQAAQAEAINAAVSALSGAAHRMALVLVSIALDPEVNPAVRVQAARAALVENLRVKEQYALEERISALEAKQT